MSAQVSESVGVYLPAADWFWLLGFLAAKSDGLTSPTLDRLLASINESMR